MKPSVQLAELMFARLVKEAILLEEDRRLLDKLADGTLGPDDWRLAVEKAIEKRGTGT